MRSFVDCGIVRKSRIKARRLAGLCGGLAAAMTLLLVILCLLTRAGNLRTVLAAAWFSLIPAGWGTLALWMFAAEPARAEARHLEGLETETPEIREGRFFLRDDTFRIPGSVRVRKVRLETGDGDLSLNLNARLWREMPEDGSLVRVRTARKFITGIEVLEAGPQEGQRKPPSRLRAARRALGRFVPAAVLCGMAVMLLTGFLFNRITDTRPEDKITIFAYCEVQNPERLAEELERAMAGSVRMVKVHPFSYALFSTDALGKADLLIVPDSARAKYRELLAGDGAVLTMYDPEKGRSLAGEYFLYTDGDNDGAYRLYFGAQSVHLEDGLARQAAELLEDMD